MSEPKRYAWKVNEENDFDLIEHSNGEYVSYEDYARLKAEVEWLKEFYDISVIPNRELKAQVERLTKAGDDLVFCMNLNSASSGDALRNWEAAKEGKQS